MSLRERINELQFEEAQLERKLKELQLTQTLVDLAASHGCENV